MTSPNAECECTHSFTCGYCLRNRKPYHWTPSKPGEPYHQGKLHGSIPKHLYDPPHWMSSADKEQYRKGFGDARKERGLE